MCYGDALFRRITAYIRNGDHAALEAVRDVYSDTPLAELIDEILRHVPENPETYETSYKARYGAL